MIKKNIKKSKNDHSCTLSLFNFLPPNPVSYHYKMEYFICNGGFGTARGRILEHTCNVVAKLECHHAIADKQRTSLAIVDVTPPRGAVYIT